MFKVNNKDTSLPLENISDRVIADRVSLKAELQSQLLFPFLRKDKEANS